MTVLQGFVGPTYQAQSPTVDAERCVNLIPEKRTAGDPKSDWWYYSTPGLGASLPCGGGPIRATFSQDGRTFAASGPDFYEWVLGVWTLRGQLLDDMAHTPVTIVSNGTGGQQLLIIASGHGYVFNLFTNICTEIADADFPRGAAVMCDFLDGYGIVLIANSATFQISALEDFTAWDALDVAQVSQTSDNLVSLTVNLDTKILTLHGSQNTNYYWDSGASFPFEPVPNAITSMGAASPWGFCKVDDVELWIGQSTNGARMAYEARGTQPAEITTPAVSFAWSQYATVSDCIGWSYEYRSHAFAVFTFPTANATWVYDHTERQWHEWLYWDESIGRYAAHLARCHCYADDVHLVGSRVDGTVYQLSGDYLDDNGTAIRRMRRSPHIAHENQWIFCPRLQLDFQVGTGLATGQGSNPQAVLRISRDGGRTYGNQRWRSLGLTGAYTTRALWWRNGRWRDGVLEMTHTDPTIVALVGAYGDFEQGSS